MHRFLLTATGIAAAIAVLAVAMPVFLGDPDGAGPRDGVAFTSERHRYTVVLPGDFLGWTRVEQPGAWELGEFLEPGANAGADEYQRTNPAVGPVLTVYVTTQPIPDWMSFDDWVAGHDEANRKAVPCFQPSTDLRIVEVSGEPARFGAWTCSDFDDSGEAWTTVQTLVAHHGRGYAIYLWPAEQGDARPPIPKLEAAATDWLSRFSFTD